MEENKDSQQAQQTPQPENPPIQPLKPLRTYEGDVANILAKRNTSAVTIALAESKRSKGGEILGNRDDLDSSQTGKKIIIIVISLLIVAAGIFGAYYLYSISPLAPSPVVQKIVQGYSSVIPVDSQTVIKVDPTAPNDMRDKIAAEITKNQAPNTIRELVLVTTDNTNPKNPVTRRIQTQDIATAMSISMPDILYRSLTPSWLLGIYANAYGQKSFFVVATNNFFQNAFAGMLQWENIMADDLKSYLVPVTINDIANTRVIAPTAKPATSTKTISTTTTPSRLSSTTIQNVPDMSAIPSLPTYTTLSGLFVDKIIKNKDLREFVASNGKIIFLYSFLDNTRIVFASDESLIAEIMTRLEKQANMR